MSFNPNDPQSFGADITPQMLAALANSNPAGASNVVPQAGSTADLESRVSGPSPTVAAAARQGAGTDAPDPSQPQGLYASHPRLAQLISGLAQALYTYGTLRNDPRYNEMQAESSRADALNAAQVQDVQSQTAVRLAQARQMSDQVPLTINGQTVYVPQSALGNYLRGGFGAQVGAASRENVAQINERAKLEAEGLHQLFESSQISKLVPDVDPQSGQYFYRALNKQGDEIKRVSVGAIPSLMSHQSSTVQYQQLDDGSIVALPKTTTSGPVIPGAGKPAAPGAPAASGQSNGAGAGGGIRIQNGVVTLNGEPLAGKGTTTNTTKTMIEAAPKVMTLVGRLEGQINGLEQSGSLGPGASRWADFWSGKVGTDDQNFRAFRTNADLLSTLLMRMHVGARGSEGIMDHFTQILGAGHESAANMHAALNEIKLYAQDVQNEAPRPTRNPAAGGGGGFAAWKAEQSQGNNNAH